jgi:hypothetical protein
MARYADQVTTAVLPLLGLGQQVLGDLDTEEGGITWWSDSLDAPRRILIADYLIELSGSCEANLVEAVMHLERVKQDWFAAGHDFQEASRSLRGQKSLFPRTERAENREVEATAHVAGFFRAIGSVLDNVAGLVVGVAGLRVKLVRADFTDLQLSADIPKGALAEGHAGRSEQLALVGAVRASIETFPDGWDRWAIDMRNTLVHRARRLTWQLSDPRRPDQFMRPLPTNPGQTDIESMARHGLLGADALHEHAADTMSGVLAATSRLVQQTASAAVQLWDRRRRSPSLIKQPREQWPVLRQGRETGFTGWNPGLMPQFGHGGALVVHPDRGTRLRSAKVMDDHRASWLDWFEDEE